jgi:cyclopropane fatty-acyl-phospholipid synthase-like methyltransferase
MNPTLSYYEENASKLSKRYESADVSNIHQTLLKTFPTNSKLLDIGCGSGRDASFMLKQGYSLTAIDGSQKMVDEAKKIHPALEPHLFTMQLPHGLDFEPNSFNGVYSIATLMHLRQEEIYKTIQNIHTLLKPKGRFLFSVSIERDDTDQNSRDPHQRLFTSFSQREWITICKNYGLHHLHTKVTVDGLNRKGIVWLTCVVEKV